MSEFVVEKRRNQHHKCPDCGGFLCKWNDMDKLSCLSCPYTIDAKREIDKEIRTIKEVKQEWQ